MILQGVKPTIQPLGEGYANRPKKANNLREEILGLAEGPWHGLHRPSGHYVGPHGCSSTGIVYGVYS